MNGSRKPVTQAAVAMLARCPAVTISRILRGDYTVASPPVMVRIYDAGMTLGFDAKGWREFCDYIANKEPDFGDSQKDLKRKRKLSIIISNPPIQKLAKQLKLQESTVKKVLCGWEITAMSVKTIKRIVVNARKMRYEISDEVMEKIKQHIKAKEKAGKNAF